MPGTRWAYARERAQLGRPAPPGGNGYRAEHQVQVEPLCRDAKVLQTYAGTDEVQVTHIARELLRG